MYFRESDFNKLRNSDQEEKHENKTLSKTFHQPVQARFSLSQWVSSDLYKLLTPATLDPYLYFLP